MSIFIKIAAFVMLKYYTFAHRGRSSIAWALFWWFLTSPPPREQLSAFQYPPLKMAPAFSNFLPPRKKQHVPLFVIFNKKFMYLCTIVHFTKKSSFIMFQLIYLYIYFLFERGPHLNFSLFFKIKMLASSFQIPPPHVSNRQQFVTPSPLKSARAIYERPQKWIWTNIFC